MSEPRSNNPKWLDELACRTRDAQCDVDNGLWSDIEHRLPPPRHGLRWVWWSAAVAAAAVAVLIADPFKHADMASHDMSQTMPAVVSQVAPSQSASGSLSEEEHIGDVPTGARTHAPMPFSLVAQLQGQDGGQSSEPSVAASSTPANVTERIDTVNLASYAGEMLPLPSCRCVETQRGAYPETLRVMPERRHQNRTSLSLYGSGDLLAQNDTRTSVVYRPMLLPMSNGRFLETRAMLQYRYHHRLPVNVGLMASHEIAHNLTAGIGLNYALYSSEVSLGEMEHFDQTVQFIGIPTALRWSFWRHGHFSTYIGAEAMAERCISAEFGDQPSDVPRRIQWSVHGMAGMKYSLSDRFGLFIEPKVSHFITEFPLTTARNEHPLVFNVKLGATIDF